MIETIAIVITIAVIVLISFILGYFLGFLKSNPETLTQVKEDFDKEERVKKGIKPGVVKRPTPERLEYLKNPQKREEEDAMKEVLKPLVEGKE